MWLIRAGIVLSVLMCTNLMISGQDENGLEPEMPDKYSFPIEDEEGDYSSPNYHVSPESFNILMESHELMKNLTSASEANVTSPSTEPPFFVNGTSLNTTRSLPTNQRTRSIEPKSVRIPIAQPVLTHYNVKPGVRAIGYDKSGLYFRPNMTSETFDVQAIYHGYLGRLRPRCSPRKVPIRPADLMKAVQAATAQVDREVAEALANFKAGNVIRSDVISADGRHLITGKLPEELKDFVDQEEAQFLEYVAKNLQETFCLRPVEIMDTLTKIPVSSIVSKYLTCSRKPESAGRCRNSRYRSYDGFCNNLKHTSWGKSNVCHVRFLPPYYEDGLFMPRSRGVSGKPLPPPRHVSLALHEAAEGEAYFTPWHFTWGQYVIHDIMSTPQSVPSHGSGVQCCSADGAKDVSKCMPIYLANNDEQARARKCINFIRSAPCPLCSMGPRQQLNLASSYIDQSAMYGGDNETVASLRTFRGGLLKVGRDRRNAPILPDSKSPLTDQCSKPALGKDKVCFRAGDARVNQQPFIQLVHSLFVRRHNQHATGLARVNPRAPDEILFQEARRLTIAELQHITYNEYLPVLLGPEMGAYFNFHETDSLFSDYEEDIDATTWNECASAACRFGHSQVTSLMHIYETAKKLSLKDSFFDPQLIHEGLTPNLIATLLNGKAAVTDPFLTPSLKNHLYFHSGQDAFGSDLAAFNIQRGRDHGIAPYVNYLKFCFGYTVRSWVDLFNFIPPENVGKLQQVYGDFQDIDLFTGGLYERKAIDSDLGPTFSCIVGIQFYHFKFGDRYFYSHQKQAGSFTPGQLAEIKSKVTLANLLCQTEPALVYSQIHAFLLPNYFNPIINCTESQRRYSINYNFWKGTF